MMRVVNGRRYNTSTAMKICSWGHEGKPRDFRWEETSLYRTPKGAWFVSGEGGPISQWRRRCGDMWGSGDGLNPVAATDARMLLEQHGTAEQCAEYFAVEDA
jgi:hypothetical protein